jgi:hypothetical protein
MPRDYPDDDDDPLDENGILKETAAVSKLVFSMPNARVPARLSTTPATTIMCVTPVLAALGARLIAVACCAMLPHCKMHGNWRNGNTNFMIRKLATLGAIRRAARAPPSSAATTQNSPGTVLLAAVANVFLKARIWRRMVIAQAMFAHKMASLGVCVAAQMVGSNAC